MKELISSIRIDRGPRHARISVWNRGGLAGVLTVNDEDADEIGRKLTDNNSTKIRQDRYNGNS